MDSTLCLDPVTCATDCAFGGADYGGTYGVTINDNAAALKSVTSNSNGKHVGTRVYLLADDSTLQMFKVKNQEFTFDVDLSNFPDQWPKDIKVIDGGADVVGWTPLANNANSSASRYDTRRNEVDVWEANSRDPAYTPNPYTVHGQTRCSADQCTNYCDQPGGNFNSSPIYLRIALHLQVRQRLLLSVLVNLDEYILDAMFFTGFLNQLSL
ncbi:hypothetical protein FRC06_004645 [Ceratobasidium sp. 370]|nr:hypothetical protein FRC06_004645 [Ceratobasidium sp. 370]